MQIKVEHFMLKPGNPFVVWFAEAKIVNDGEEASGGEVKRLYLVAALLTITCLAGLAPAESSAQNQTTDQNQPQESLADMARKQRAREGEVKPPVGGKVLTNDDLRVAAGQADTKNALSISLPGKAWVVEVHAQGFRLEADQSAPGGKRRIMASDVARGLVLSVQLEQVDHQPNLDECRQSQRDRVKAFTGKLDLQDVKYWDDGKTAFVEYLLPEYQGRPVKHRSLFACFSHEDVFVDVHISKTPFEPKDEIMLSAVMGTIYVTDRKAENSSGSAANSMELFREGSRLYEQRKFREAIPPYQRALDLEKKERRLQRHFWRVLVDNLGMAYGITGDLKRAKETFEYGVSQEKTYPMFYYNLACTYAEMNNIESTMSNLKTAFGYKENAIKGETMPDPRSDDSFQRFMNNEEFRKLVDSLAAPPR
jgi:hypothetical protein